MTTVDDGPKLDMLDATELLRRLEIALGALADIALAEDLDERGRRKKAKRIYEELSGNNLER